MQPHPPARDPVAAIAAALDSGGEIRIINPTLALLSSVVAQAGPSSHGGRLELLVTTPVARAVEDRFPTAAQLADLAANDRLSMRVSSTSHAGTLVDGALTGVVYARAAVPALLAIDPDVWGGWFAHSWEAAVTDARPIEHPTVGYQRLCTTLAERVSGPVADRFDQLVRAARAQLPVDAEIDPTALALLATGWCGGELADVTAWGVDMGVASRATFSRVKTQLVEAALLETTPIPQAVGRPRLRLELTPQHAEPPDAAALIAAAGSVLR